MVVVVGMTNRPSSELLGLLVVYAIVVFTVTLAACVPLGLLLGVMGHRPIGLGG